MKKGKQGMGELIERDTAASVFYRGKTVVKSSERERCPRPSFNTNDECIMLIRKRQ